MGIGRRQFIKLTGLALAGLQVNPSLSVITNDNIYINKKLGILFHKPDNWGFIKVTDFGKLKDKQILGHGLDDIKDEVWEDLGDPICVATKYYIDTPENKGVFSPTITLQITPKSEIDESETLTFEEVMGMSAYGTSKILQNFKILKKEGPFELSGCMFYEFQCEYMFEHIDLPKPLKVKLISLKTEHNGFYYDFNFHQSKEQNQTAEQEYEQFKRTIKLI